MASDPFYQLCILIPNSAYFAVHSSQLPSSEEYSWALEPLCPYRELKVFRNFISTCPCPSSPHPNYPRIALTSLIVPVMTTKPPRKVCATVANVPCLWSCQDAPFRNTGTPQKHQQHKFLGNWRLPRKGEHDLWGALWVQLVWLFGAGRGTLVSQKRLCLLVSGP